MAFFANLLAIVRKPVFGLIPLFPGAQDMSWIPDGSSNLPTQYAAEAPGGYVSAPTATFTFSANPKYIVYNGQLLKPGNDFTAAGPVITLAVTAGAGQEIYAIV